ADASHLVRIRFQRCDVGMEAVPQTRFQGQRLDHADALDHLLHGLDGSRTAVPLSQRYCFDSARQLAQAYRHWRNHDEADEGEQRILIDHDAKKTNQSEEVTTQRIDDETDDK